MLGLLLAWAATHRLADRLPARTLVFSTGAAGALFGDFVTHSALGPGSGLPLPASAESILEGELPADPRAFARRLDGVLTKGLGGSKAA